MAAKCKHWLYDHYFIITLVLLSLVFLLWSSMDFLRTWSFLSSGTAAVLGLSYFVLRQHLDETRLFKELFAAFNARYDAMNERLYALRDAPRTQPLTFEETTLLYDYFNLCAEEFLYYRKGFIYPEVWLAWQNGMKIFCDFPRVRELWETELRTNSYYGFTLPC